MGQVVATITKAKYNKHRKPTRTRTRASKIKPRRSHAGSRHRSNARQLQFREGFGEGYREGVHSGTQSYPTLFEGTSIVIPTYNQLNMLEQCIESIMDNTDLPYEIIVVDNASTDGTAAYLLGLGGQVRFRVLDNNRGFAGAINMGMMMAKGRTIMLLNNDTLATENWLDNLLICLNSDEGIGMVGPITNYISGDQKVDVPYQDVVDMPKFARENNKSDPSRWRQIERLTGFCLLFRRELFEGIGYFDEGFEVGNYEDDDYNIRVRLLGKKIVMAQDTFIHHFGSISMKALGDRFQEVNDRNQLYFMDKWSNPNEWIQEARQHSDPLEGQLQHSAHFYPEQVVVQAIGANRYWIEHGKRRLIEGELSIPTIRVSQIDLRLWPLEPPIAAEEVEHLWRGSGDEVSIQSGVVLLPDGNTFHMEGGVARRIISPAVMRAWSLHLKPHKNITLEQLEDKVHGLPIVAPPLLRQVL
ncbi:glycosyltransferase family 2 protein [Cohnella abietis]|uniref:Glycosyltransferase 2-like domain-containing protein n=1 Tax=Cohnella abietis TaxID=2507935 RepID=A0A3T1DA99_9BACL|nr:glycosyltransferase family 2 protein [Cohnella abietis]BBI35021.1 hypothetical protein KCTCHS21_44200 [Cohnella abietis]